MVDQRVEECKVEETLKSVYVVETAIFVAERIIITLFTLVFPDVNPTALFLCFSTFLYTLEFQKRAVAVSQTSLQSRHYADRSFEKSYVFWLERTTIIILAFLRRNPYHWYIVVGLFAISNTLYLQKKLDCWLLPILENLENEEDRNGGRVMKEVEGDNNDDEVEEAELCSFEKFLLCFQGLAFLFLLSSSPIVSILHYPLFFSNLLLTLCFGVRQVLPYPLPIYYSCVFWMERAETVILLSYKHFGITSYKFLPFTLFVLSNSLHIIMNYMPCIFEQKVEKISGQNISGTPSTLKPKESGKEHLETDAKNQADHDGVIINNVHNAKNQADHDGVIINNVHKSDHEDDDDYSEDYSDDDDDYVEEEEEDDEEEEEEEEDEDNEEDEDDDDDDVSSWESNPIAELVYSNVDSEDDEEEDEDDDDVSSWESNPIAELVSSNVDSEDDEEEEDEDDVSSWEELKRNPISELVSPNVDSEDDEEEEDEEDVSSWEELKSNPIAELVSSNVDSEDDEDEEDEEDDDVSSWEELKSNLITELVSSNAVAAAAKEEAKSDEQEEEQRVVTHNHEEDDAKYKRKMTEAAVALVEFRLEKSQESADQYYKKYIAQILKYLSKCEEDKKNLNEKLNVSKAACEEQRQKWEEERKDLISKLKNATSLLEHHKDTVDSFNEDRCKWEEEKAKLKSDIEELTSQNGENALSLMNHFEVHCRESMADKELLTAKLRAAKESKKYYRGMLHESENMRLQLLEDNKQLAAKLQDATLEADHYYTLLHNFDERCRSWLEAYSYYNTHAPPTNAI